MGNASQCLQKQSYRSASYVYGAHRHHTRVSNKAQADVNEFLGSICPIKPSFSVCDLFA